MLSAPLRWHRVPASTLPPKAGGPLSFQILTGLRIERSERGQPGEFDGMTNEQLLTELRGLGINVTLDDEPPSSAVN
jgi:hypothetical protein